MSSRATLTENKKKLRGYYLAIFLLTFFLYGNGIRNGYSLDDNYVTATGPNNPNPKIQKGIAGIPEIFTSHYFESDKQSFEYRPVVLSSYAIEYQFFGSSPHISHFINVLMYAFSCALLFSTLLKFLTRSSVLFSFIVTILFLVHPVHTEVVDNLKSRDELLSFLFGLLSVRSFWEAANGEGIKKIIIAIVFLVLALMCKITAVLFLALVPFVLYFFTQLPIKRIIFLAALAAVSLLIYGLVRSFLFHDTGQQREYAFFENPLFYEKGWLQKLPLALFTLGYYIRLLVLPHPLSCYYGFKVIPFVDWSTVLVWGALVVHLWLAFLAWKGIRSRSVLGFALVVYLVGVLPLAQIKTPVVGVVGERFIYFSSLGFCLAIVHLLFKWTKTAMNDPEIKWKALNQPFRIVSVVVLLLCSIKVISRNKAWKDELTLFRTDLKHYENSCNLNYITANAISNQIRRLPGSVERSALITEATSYYRKAAELMEEGVEKYPNDYITLNNLGTIYVDIFQQPDKAQPLFKRAKIIKPSNRDAEYNYAFCYERRNMTDSAIVEYEKLASTDPGYLPVFLRLHELYLGRKEYKKAVDAGSSALTLDPSRIDIYINLGNSYMLLGDTARGLQSFEGAVKHAPTDVVLMQKVSDVFKAVGDTAKAREYAIRAGSR